MEYRNIGRSGLKVSTIALGAWLNVTTRDAEGERALRRALDAGVTFLDTANVYGQGEAETAWGRWLADVPRDSFVLASKVFFPMGAGVYEKGLSRKHVRASIDASLRRLGTDHLDLYQCHRYDPETPIEEVVRTMDDLISAGKILHWGTSMWPADALRKACAFARANGREGPISDQPCHNLLDRSIEREVVPACVELGLGVLPFSPLAGGALTGKYLDGIPSGTRGSHPDNAMFLRRFLEPDQIARTRALVALAAAAGIPPATLAVRWLLARPTVSSVIVGASSVAQLDQLLAAESAVVPPSVLAEATRLSAAPTTP